MSEYEGFVRAVLRRSLRICPKENVIVESWNHGLDIAREFVYQLRAIGARPMNLVEDEEGYWRAVETLPVSKLGHVSKAEWSAISNADAYVFIPGPADIDRYRKNMPRAGSATAYNAEWYRRAKKAGLRGARILLGYATRERAASYGFDLQGWRANLLAAGSVDFSSIGRRGRRVGKLLSAAAEVVLTAPNGTDLTFRLRGRPAQVNDGIVDEADVKAGEFMENVPPGTVYVTPEEGSAEGTIVFDRPAYRSGLTIPDVRMEFRDGHATWTAGVNSEIVRTSWDRAKGGKDRLGFLSAGLNPLAAYGFLQDDLVAGAVGIDIGDNSEFGGRNKSDFSFGSQLSKATLRVGGKTVVDAGRLVP